MERAPLLPAPGDELVRKAKWPQRGGRRGGDLVDVNGQSLDSSPGSSPS